MSVFDDLLTAMDKLNDPTAGAAVKWKKQLRDPSSPVDVKTRAGVLDTLDDAFHSERSAFSSFTGPKPQEEFVMLVEGYLQMTKGLYTFLLNSGVADPALNQDVEDALHQVTALAPKARAALQIPAQPDNLFLITMQHLIGQKKTVGGVKLSVVTQANYDQTQKLFKRESFSLDDKEIQSLTDSWETVIASFVEDNDPLSNPALANQVNVKGVTLAKADAEANLFTMHALLEVLYERLEVNVRRTTVEIVSASF